MKTKLSSIQAGGQIERAGVTALLAALISLLAAAPSSSGRDGHRKGLVTGAGLGVAPISRFSRPDTHENGVGPAMTMFLGYGFSERNLIVVEGNAVFRPSALYSKEAEGWTDWDGHALGDQWLFQGLGGAVWYHYGRDSLKSPFFALGVGAYRFSASPEGHNDAGLGWLLGSGYQFSRRMQLGAYCTFGETHNYFMGQFKHIQVSILLTMLQI